MIVLLLLFSLLTTSGIILRGIEIDYGNSYGGICNPAGAIPPEPLLDGQCLSYFFPLNISSPTDPTFAGVSFFLDCVHYNLQIWAEVDCQGNNRTFSFNNTGILCIMEGNGEGIDIGFGCASSSSPTNRPSAVPTVKPSRVPSISPSTSRPSATPTMFPTSSPSTSKPSHAPTDSPTTSTPTTSPLSAVCKPEYRASQTACLSKKSFCSRIGVNMKWLV